MKRRGASKIFIFLLISFLGSFTLLGFSKPQTAQSLGPCQIAPIGQVSKRALEIHKELIYWFTAAQEEYSILLEEASKIIPLLAQCPIDNCKIDQSMCPDSCEPDKCSVAASCKPISGRDQDTCPEEVREKIDKLAEEMKPHQERLKEIIINIGKLGFPIPINLFGISLAGELAELKQKLQTGKALISGYNLTTSVLLSCNQAESLGVVPSCFKSTLSFFGITIPVSTSPDSNIDYFICQR